MKTQHDYVPAAESAVEDSEVRFRQLADAINDYVFTVSIVNGTPMNTHHSASCAKVTGYSPAEFAIDPTLWIRMVLPEDRALVNHQVAQILCGRDTPSIEHRIRRKDNVVRWVLNTSIPSYDDLGKLTSYDGVVRDVTERRRLAEERMNAPSRPRTTNENADERFESTDLELGGMLESKRQLIADLLQEDLQQLLVAARYQLDRLASKAVHDPSFNRALEGVNGLLGQCVQKARDISRELTDVSPLGFETKGHDK